MPDESVPNVAAPRHTVSIVIPAYNEAARLRACLESIAAQTVAPLEVIVVDNGSTDNTVEIAQSFAFVRVCHEPRHGIVHARNTGFDAARGDIIGRIDADTRLFPGWVGHVLHYFSEAAHMQTALSGRGYFYNLRWPKLVGLVQHFIAFRWDRLLLGDNILWGSNMAIPRQLWHDVKPALCTRDDIHEDIDLAIHLHRTGHHVAYRKSLLVGVEMRRVHTNRAELWGNLKWWPQTFKVHGIKTWPLAWLAAAVLYCFTPFALLAERIATVFGRKPLKNASDAHQRLG